MAKKPLALLTSCTVTRNFDPIVKIADAPIFSYMGELCDWWVTQMKESPTAKRKTPGELYAGTSFSAITEIAQRIGHENIYIVTGGIGLGKYTDKITPYDFTSHTKAEHNAPQHVTEEKFLPHVWWSKINEGMGRSPQPITELLDKYDAIVAALPKQFIKYIVGDLQSCGEEARRERIFIPVPFSMTGSVSKDVRSALVPYTGAYVDDVAFSRTDKAQRVVQKFITEAEQDGGFVEYAAKVSNMTQNKTGNNEETDYVKMFGDHPELLETHSIGEAILRAKQLGYKVGGRSRFAGAWRNATGQIEVRTTKAEEAQASKALAKVLKHMRPVEAADDEIILTRIGIFLQALKAVAPGTAFTTKEIVEWAKEAYGNDLHGMDNTNKVTYLIMYNLEHLGLELLDSGSRKAYRLAQ